MYIEKKYLQKGQYFNDVFPKKGIVLHHTVSRSAKSARDWWNFTPEIIGTAYSIEKNGHICENFPPELWAHHLGLRTKNNRAINASTIGIEIVNEGVLFEEKTGEKRWMRPGDGPLYTKGDEIRMPVWRNAEYWAPYTPEQTRSAALLARFLFIKYLGGIPPTAQDIAPPLAFDIQTPRKYKLWYHHSVRQDKTDLGPAFDYKEFNRIFLSAH